MRAETDYILRTPRGVFLLAKILLLGYTELEKSVITVSSL